MSVILRASSVASINNQLAGSNDAAIFRCTPIKDSSYTGTFGSIYVPASLVDAYKTANYWSDIADRITAIVD